MASLTYSNGALLYQSQYDPSLVQALKAAIPDNERRWDGGRKVWIVAPQHGKALAQITERYLGEVISVPAVKAQAAILETRALDVRYIGTVKQRSVDDSSAYGFCGGSWSVCFPEKVLRNWFSAESKPDEAITLYQVLGLAQSATADDIKSAYRRLARQWHPDVCKEPDAKEQFLKIKHSYDILSDVNMRARYEAGLALEASIKNQKPSLSSKVVAVTGYRSPLRCGYILAEGVDRLSRFWVEKILAWEDITDRYGRVLVVSWPAGSDTFLESWS